MTEPLEDLYMRRCIQLATLGMGTVAPNPMVGSVVVHDNKIIGEGYHQQFGQAHAEVHAINQCIARGMGHLLPESTLYVNLEPCAHYGKTPPCALLIVEHRIPRVVIGCIDSFAQVSGKGVERLREAGILVKIGVLEKECLELNKRFFTFHAHKRPYIILKWAQTRNGFIGKKDVPNVMISNWLSQKRNHQMRAQEAAIMVGFHTAIQDNPALTTRHWTGHSPCRIIVDRRLATPAESKFYEPGAQTIIYNELEDKTYNHIEYRKIDFNLNILPQMVADLYQKNIQSLIVEGGRALLQSFLDMKLYDELHVFESNLVTEMDVLSPQVEVNFNYTKILIDNQLKIYIRS